MKLYSPSYLVQSFPRLFWSLVVSKPQLVWQVETIFLLLRWIVLKEGSKIFEKKNSHFINLSLRCITYLITIFSSIVWIYRYGMGPSIYRVSHSKDWKVILLWWGYRFWFLLNFWVLHVHEISPFMPNSSVFIFLMLRVLYRMICKS